MYLAVLLAEVFLMLLLGEVLQRNSQFRRITQMKWLDLVLEKPKRVTDPSLDA